jgi:UDP-3-O-[3-hydroxymyristoyl] N-acetylglucosamine deacetylase
MDGLSPSALVLASSPFRDERGSLQHTLKSPIGCVGVGVHSGRRVSLTLVPADIDTGIVFRRTDLGDCDIPARFDLVTDTRLCTVLTDPADPSCSVGTVEHVMAALAGAGIDNARVEVDGPELPILDGSAAPFLFLIDCAGIVSQAAFRGRIDVLRPIRVEDGAAYAELLPETYEGQGALDMAMSIDFAAAAIGRQALSLTLSEDTFRTKLAEARTFALAGDIARLHEAGLALGGSLQNAVVVDGAKVLNPAGLRMEDEFVRHKLLDAVGDLALAGAPIAGRFVAHRSGHALNNQLLRALFADRTAWRRVGADAQPAEPAWMRPAAREMTFATA